MIISYFEHISFASPGYFTLVLLIPIMVYFYFRKQDHFNAGFKISSGKRLQGLSSWKQYGRHSLFFLRIAALLSIIIALGRPQLQHPEQDVTGEGIDIILCIDISGSMTAQDFKPNRMEAAKQVAAGFVDQRITDRIGIVIFSGESFTQCPLTTDKAVLHNAIDNIQSGLLIDGTSIGDGLATSVDRLRASHAKSKVVILLTDGENNGGLIGPENAKEIAKTFGVKVYTIGVGTEGYAPIPLQTGLGVVSQEMKVTIDEKLLKEIAGETGGKYFRAKDNQGLAGIYKEIDGLEKSKVLITNYTKYTEKFFPFVIMALVLLFWNLP